MDIWNTMEKLQTQNRPSQSLLLMLPLPRMVLPPPYPSHGLLDSYLLFNIFLSCELLTETLLVPQARIGSVLSSIFRVCLFSLFKWLSMKICVMVAGYSNCQGKDYAWFLCLPWSFAHGKSLVLCFLENQKEWIIREQWEKELLSSKESHL